MRRLIALLTAGVMILMIAAPALAKPPMEPGAEGPFYCRDDDGSTLVYWGYLGQQYPHVMNVYFEDSEAVAVPITVYTSDADGTRGDWIWSGKGLIGADLPGLTWCWCQGCLPGAIWENGYWVGGDYAFRGASDQQP